MRVVRKLGKDLQFLRSVVAVDVERRIGFGEAFGLRVAKSVSKLDAILSHASENVITGSVENAGNALDLISGEAAAERSNDGDASADAAFELEADLLRLGGLHEAKPMRGQQGLVSGDDVLTTLEGVLHERARGVHSADKFDNKVASVVEHALGTRGEQSRIDSGTFFGRIAYQNLGDAERGSSALADERVVAREQFDEPTPHSSAAEQADLELANRHRRYFEPPAIEGTSRTSSPS